VKAISTILNAWQAQRCKLATNGWIHGASNLMAVISKSDPLQSQKINKYNALMVSTKSGPVESFGEYRA